MPGTDHLQKRLKKTAVPHIFQWSKQPTQAAENRKSRAKRKLIMEEEVAQKKMRAEEEMAKQRDLAVENIGAEVFVTATDDTVAGTS